MSAIRTPESKPTLLARAFDVIRHPVATVKMAAEIGGASVAATVAVLAGPTVVERAVDTVGYEVDLDDEAYAEQGPCPTGEHVRPGSWDDINGDGVMQYNEVACEYDTPPTNPTTPPTNPTTPPTTAKPPTGGGGGGTSTTPPVSYEVVSVDIDGDGYIAKVTVATQSGQEVSRSPAECNDLTVCDFKDTEPAGQGGIGEEGVAQMCEILLGYGLDLYNLPPNLAELQPVIEQIGRSVNPSSFMTELQNVLAFTGNNLPDPTTSTVAPTTAGPTTSIDATQPCTTIGEAPDSTTGSTDPVTTPTTNEGAGGGGDTGSDGDGSDGGSSEALGTGLAVGGVVALLAALALALARRRRHGDHYPAVSAH